jgi:hypothetical protein
VGRLFCSRPIYPRPAAPAWITHYPFFNLADFEKVPSCNSRTTCLPSPHGLTPFGPGNSGRNILDGPGLAFIKMSLSKDFRVGENGRLQFRETLKAFNHPIAEPRLRCPKRRHHQRCPGQRERRPQNASRSAVRVLGRHEMTRQARRDRVGQRRSLRSEVRRSRRPVLPGATWVPDVGNGPRELKSARTDLVTPRPACAARF